MAISADPANASAFEKNHDHGRCIHNAMERALRLCKQNGARLTPVRQRVLELIWQSHRPLGAYQLLEQLSKEGFNSAPPTVYRALEFLLEQGLAHRITSLNAFIGCSHPGCRHQGYFLICRSCGSAEELPSESLAESLRQQVSQRGFLVESETVELSGLCPDCREQESH
ncbi:transcriptional repressor [Motiliproteus coralliicola]|uniref:Transcriptional repressor n=1 Tax=Motiliproteus coralliicola TaxID=2283196 RepID=A0A369WA52_9GAMM|nr:Fur family transcriptional regulator [Motiliproteus coralliicola]RDE18890.1 transcriptional repressor [Motiliproteus coralliicola]